MTTSGGNFFRFLDLPKELRLMVYERLPITIRHHTLQDPAHEVGHYARPFKTLPEFIHVVRCPLYAILRVCCQMRAEAQTLLDRTFVYEPPRYIIDTPALATMLSPRFTYFNILASIQDTEDRIRDGLHPGQTLESCLRRIERMIPRYVQLDIGGRGKYLSDSAYAYVHDFIISCAKWNICAEACSVPRHWDFDIGIALRVPTASSPDDPADSLMSVPNLLDHIGRPSAGVARVMVLPCSADAARFAKSVKVEVEGRARQGAGYSGLRSAYFVEEEYEGGWKGDWEETLEEGVGTGVLGSVRTGGLVGSLWAGISKTRGWVRG